MDKNLKNIGWKLMKDILDKEMPQKKKKRSFFYWYLFSGILFISSISYWKFLHANNQKFNNTIQQQITKSTSPHIASLNSSSYSQNNDIPSAMKNNSENKLSDAHEEVKTDILSSKFDASPLQNKASVLMQPLAPENKVAAESVYQKSLNTSLVNEKKVKIKSEPENNQAIFTLGKEIVKSEINSSVEANKNTENINTEITIEKREEINIERIANKNLDDLLYVNIVNLSLNLVRPQSSNKNGLIGLYVSAGVSSVPFEFNHNIPMAGIRSSVNLNKNFKISTGLLYGRSVRDSIQFLYDYRASNVDNSFSTPSIVNGISYFNLTNLQVYKFNTIAIPLVGEYRIYKNIWARGGFSYNINKAKKVNYNVEAKNTSSNYNNEKVDELIDVNLLKNQLTWQGGVGIDVSKRLSLTLDLLGRSDFINSVNKSNNPQVQLFASYRVL